VRRMQMQMQGLLAVCLVRSVLYSLFALEVGRSRGCWVCFEFALNTGTGTGTPVPLSSVLWPLGNPHHALYAYLVLIKKGHARTHAREGFLPHIA
jgi:hypothetical protein